MPLQRWRIAGVALAVTLAAPSAALSQYLGHDIRGDNGVNAGSQAPPGVYVAVPFYRYDVDSLHDRDGNQRAAGFGLPTLQGVGLTIAVVSKFKILGGRYAFAVAPLFFMQEVIDLPRAGLTAETGFNYFDTFYQPISLGWTTKRADFIAGYGFWAPTGNFQAHDGLGMWSHEISAGTTLYLDRRRRFSVATAADLELHTNKEDQDIHVGNILTLEGGLAARFARGAGALGLAYYAQWKVTDDAGTDIPRGALAALGILGKQNVYGLGPELTLPFFAKGTTVGLATVRYLWETGATSTFEGQALFVAITLGKLAP